MGTSARSENGPEGSNGGAVSSIPTLSHSLTLTARGADGPGSALCSHAEVRWVAVKHWGGVLIVWDLECSAVWRILLVPIWLPAPFV
ncbi:unnamed protein product [Gadus morhua 'NCC']